MGLDISHSVVEIEDDELAIVKKVNVNVEDGSVINAFIKDWKALSKGYDRFHFVHTAKGRNVVACLLATKWIKRGETFYLVGKVLDFAVDEVEKDKRGLIRQTNFNRRKVVIVPDLAYMGKGDWSHKELLVLPKVLSLKGVWGVVSLS
ncbi:hypothetical protein PVK06_027173 [Gossypium arboreum]|uniref:RNase H type-1 domain-containing protein n=1 Tax=Gossypium arboreum TaxID=29729 RepID=A0ABR0NZM6_GOSAR|nr:hypothetical protein PVK06_027173 [Gossypium arboreum]